MRKRVIALTLSAMLFALCSVAEAQQPKKVPWIGLLRSSSTEGKNIIIEKRYAEGKVQIVPDLTDGPTFFHITLLIL